MMSRMFPENRIVEYIASITPRSVRSPNVAPRIIARMQPMVAPSVVVTRPA